MSASSTETGIRMQTPRWRYLPLSGVTVSVYLNALHAMHSNNWSHGNGLKDRVKDMIKRKLSIKLLLNVCSESWPKYGERAGYKIICFDINKRFNINQHYSSIVNS